MYVPLAAMYETMPREALHVNKYLDKSENKLKKTPDKKSKYQGGRNIRP